MFAASATPLWAPLDARRFRAELPLLPKETWPSSRNGGVRVPAGFRIIAPAAAVAPSPIYRRISLSTPILQIHSNPLARERGLLHQRLPSRVAAHASIATSDSRYRFPRWRPLQLPVTQIG